MQNDPARQDWCNDTRRHAISPWWTYGTPRSYAPAMIVMAMELPPPPRRSVLQCGCASFTAARRVAARFASELAAVPCQVIRVVQEAIEAAHQVRYLRLCQYSQVGNQSMSASPLVDI